VRSTSSLRPPRCGWRSVTSDSGKRTVMPCSAHAVKICAGDAARRSAGARSRPRPPHDRAMRAEVLEVCDQGRPLERTPPSPGHSSSTKPTTRVGVSASRSMSWARERARGWCRPRARGARGLRSCRAREAEAQRFAVAEHEQAAVPQNATRKVGVTALSLSRTLQTAMSRVPKANCAQRLGEAAAAERRTARGVEAHDTEADVPRADEPDEEQEVHDAQAHGEELVEPDLLGAGAFEQHRRREGRDHAQEVEPGERAAELAALRGRPTCSRWEPSQGFEVDAVTRPPRESARDSCRRRHRSGSAPRRAPWPARRRVARARRAPSGAASLLVHDQHDAVHERREHDAVAHRRERRSVDQHVSEALPHAREHIAHTLRARARWGSGVCSRPPGSRSPFSGARGGAASHRARPGPSVRPALFGHRSTAVAARAAQVCVDHEYRCAEPREHERRMERGGGLALGVGTAREEDRVRRLTGLGEQDAGADRAVGFGDGRRRLVRGTRSTPLG